MAEIIIGIGLGFFLAAYIFNEKTRNGVNKFLSSKRKPTEKEKPKAKSRGGKA